MIVLFMGVYLRKVYKFSSVHISFSTGAYSLTISYSSNEMSVKHYRIRTLDNGGFYISTKINFNTLVDLVSHYRSKFGFYYSYTGCPRSRASYRVTIILSLKKSSL